MSATPGAGTAALTPEAVDSRSADPWEVVKGQRPLTDVAARSMVVPFGAGDHERAARGHELLRARMTPENLVQVGVARGLTEAAILACEDARLSIAARHQGLSQVEAGSSPPELAKAAVDHLVALALAQAQAKTGLNMGRGAASALAGNPREALHRAACVATAVHGTVAARDALIRLAAGNRITCAQNFAEYATKTLEMGWQDPQTTFKAAHYLDAILAEDGDGEGVPDEHDKSKGIDRFDEKVDPNVIDKAGDVEADADKVILLTPPLAGGKRQVRQRKRAQDIGVLARPTETLRMEAGFPFTRKRRVEGGVVLIDASGSMGFGHEELTEIVQAVPGALVMLHAGRDGERAWLTVAGKGGLCISEGHLRSARNTMSGGNHNDAGCMLAASRLAKDVKGPRFWVTDKGWCDVNGEYTHQTRQVGEALARRERFEIVPAIDDIWQS